MDLKYLNNKSWSGITREERYFCAELFFELRKDLRPFLGLIGRAGSPKEYEVGYEACFYRDVLKEYGKSAHEAKLPQKRTFDLLLLSEDELIIIEAKAFQGFDSAQLSSIEREQEVITKLFTLIGHPVPKVSMVAICSSGYTPKESTTKCFSYIIRWDELAKVYKHSCDIFKRADMIYEKRPNTIDRQ